jgi:hypothetical protein
MRATFTFILATVALTGTAMSDPGWHGATSKGCDRICIDFGRTVDAGNWKGNSRHIFFVCRADVNNEGKRPGYNMDAAYGLDKCVVPHGGKEVAVTTFECLCNSKDRVK